MILNSLSLLLFQYIINVYNNSQYCVQILSHMYTLIYINLDFRRITIHQHSQSFYLKFHLIVLVFFPSRDLWNWIKLAGDSSKQMRYKMILLITKFQSWRKYFIKSPNYYLFTTILHHLFSNATLYYTALFLTSLFLLLS